MATNLSLFEPFVSTDIYGVPSPTLQFFLRQAAIKFCTDTHVINKMLSISVESSDIDTDLHDSVDLDISEYSASMQPITLMRLNINGRDWDVHYSDIQTTISDAENVLGASVKYFTFPDDNTIRIFGMEACDLTVQVALKPTQTATTVEDKLFNDWIDPIVADAKARLFALSNKSWSDLTAAAHNSTLYRRGVSTAKAKVRKGFSTKSLEIQGREFGF